ncbi:unnamed protein product [Adineta steineri]|uniref:Uncharacterized protein n=1 Tax=Adineta steineri TaxID=433720 RepID=A0A819D5N1_9BILA|nr:unnamed protein product [Adineta steineri]
MLSFQNEQKQYTFKLFKHDVDSLATSLLALDFNKNDHFAVWLLNISENAVNVNLAYVENELEFCISKVRCEGIILSSSVAM